MFFINLEILSSEKFLGLLPEAYLPFDPIVDGVNKN